MFNHQPPVLFAFARCPWRGGSLTELLDHWCDDWWPVSETPAGPVSASEPNPITAEDVKDMAYFKAESDERAANETVPAPRPKRKPKSVKFSFDNAVDHKPGHEFIDEPALRPRKTRAKRPAPVGEIELAPTETAPDGGGNAQSAGVRPPTPFARGTERIKAGDAWKRQTPARAIQYCKCGIALPSWLSDKCENCGRPTK